MKFLIICTLALTAYLFYTYEPQKVDYRVENWRSIISNVELNGASVQQVKKGVYLLAGQLCDDASFQDKIGRSSFECNKSLDNLGLMCEKKIFRGAPNYYHSEPEVAAIGRRFTACVRAS